MWCVAPLGVSQTIGIKGATGTGSRFIRDLLHGARILNALKEDSFDSLILDDPDYLPHML